MNVPMPGKHVCEQFAYIFGCDVIDFWDAEGFDFDQFKSKFFPGWTVADEQLLKAVEVIYGVHAAEVFERVLMHQIHSVAVYERGGLN